MGLKNVSRFFRIFFLNPVGHNGSTWAQHKMEHTQQYYNEITDIIALFSSPEDAYSKAWLKIQLKSKDSIFYKYGMKLF